MTVKTSVLAATLCILGPITGITACGGVGYSSQRAPADPAFEACRDQLFEHADSNSDGVLTPYEAAPEPLSLGSRYFAIADTNGDGVVDYPEYRTLGLFVSCEICPAARGCEHDR